MQEPSLTEEAKYSVAKDPGEPTQEELERRYITHLPFRSWCPVCIEAKGKEDPHYKVKVKSEKAKIGLDYKSF